MKTKKKSILDYSLYHLLWKKSMLGKVTYALIPFLLIISFGIIIVFSGAGQKDGNKFYSFLSDYSNCYMLGYIFFFMYFVHGLFLPFFNKQVELLGNKVSGPVNQKYKTNIRFARGTITVVSYLLSGFAIPFIYVANKAGENNWYSKLSNAELMYYSFLIVMAWIMSIRLFTIILVDSVAIYKYLQHKIAIKK